MSENNFMVRVHADARAVNALYDGDGVINFHNSIGTVYIFYACKMYTVFSTECAEIYNPTSKYRKTPYNNNLQNGVFMFARSFLTVAAM